MAAEPSSADFRGTLGRYALFGEIASGGMATVHLARLLGSVGFARTVAIKRLHPHLAKDPDFVAMFLEEARLAARVRHPNVVATLDVVCEDNELFLVLEYVAGESLSRLIRRARDDGSRIEPRFAVAMMCAALEGLQAAHDATSERGVPLGIVHRDVSPQNIHVGLDGVARVLDFGIAKATNRVQETRSDQIKGKVQYMSPEQLAKGPIDRRADVYSAAVVLWEALTSRRLFKADEVPQLVYAIMNDEVERPSAIAPELPAGLDEIVMKGLDRDPDNRWESARDMAVALERVLMPAPPREIGAWVRSTAGNALEWRIDLVHRIESETSSSVVPPLPDSIPPTDLSSGVMKNGKANDESGPERVYDDRDEAGAGEGDEPAPSFRVEVTGATEHGHSHSRTVKIAAIAVAILVVASLAVIVRVFQLRESTPQQDQAAAASSAKEAETAIGLGIARPTASAASASSPAPANLAAKPAANATSAPPPAAPRPDASLLRPAVTIPATPAASDCDNPFYVDAKGARHPKPHCFKH